MENVPSGSVVGRALPDIGAVHDLRRAEPDLRVNCGTRDQLAYSHIDC